MRLDQGGHLTHGSPVNFSGRIYDFVSYGVDRELRAHRLRRAPRRSRSPSARSSSSPGRPPTPAPSTSPRSARSPTTCGALLMVDAAHIAGLIAGGAHPSPVPYADIVTTTTHKTLRGPRAGAIMCREQFAAAIDKAVFPGLQGGPLMHVVAAKAVAFKEAMQPEFADYAAADRAQRRRAGRRARRRGLPHRVGRHRQPPHARRPAALRRHRQGGAGGARPGRDHLQQERDPERPREAVRHERPAARHRRGHHRGHARARDARDRVADGAGAAQGRRRPHRRRRRAPRPPTASCGRSSSPVPDERSATSAGEPRALERATACVRVPDRRRGRRGRHVPADVRDALDRAPHRRDRDARPAQRAHEADAVARRRGDVRRVPGRDGGGVADRPVPRDVRRQHRTARAAARRRQ